MVGQGLSIFYLFESWRYTFYTWFEISPRFAFHVFLIQTSSRRKRQSVCSDTTVCYCVPRDSDNCFFRENSVFINHCVIKVSRQEVSNLSVRFEVAAINKAGISSLPKSYTVPSSMSSGIKLL